MSNQNKGEGTIASNRRFVRAAIEKIPDYAAKFKNPEDLNNTVLVIADTMGAISPPDCTEIAHKRDEAKASLLNAKNKCELFEGIKLATAFEEVDSIHFIVQDRAQAVDLLTKLLDDPSHSALKAKILNNRACAYIFGDSFPKAEEDLQKASSEASEEAVKGKITKNREQLKIIEDKWKEWIAQQAEYDKCIGSQ